MLQEGQQIGVYTLIRKLGIGGFGEVWLAERRTELVTTQVALKFSLDKNVDLDLVKNEALVWSKANGHPNVLPIIEANIYDGHVVIVSEFAPDGSLEDLLRKRTLLPVKSALELSIGVLSGLQFLHSKQIIHRDIKPANVLLQGETPRLTDFGVSRLAHGNTSISQTIAGTPKYMSPETFDGKRNAQTDIWSVGVMLYQMLSGKLPFPQEETTELLGAIVLKQPEALPDYIPQALKNIVEHSLAKNPFQRYQTADQMRQELFKVLTQLPDTSNEPTYKAQITASKPASPVTPFNLVNPTIPLQAVSNKESQQTLLQQPVQTQNKPSKLPMILGGLGVLAFLFVGVLGAGSYYLFRNYQGVSNSPTPNILPTPAKTPAQQQPTKTPQQPKTDGFIYDSTEELEQVIALMEQEVGGKLKLTKFNIYPTYVIAMGQDPNNVENYDEYTYRNGSVTSEPEKILIPHDKDPAKLFSTDEVDWKAIPNLVKTVREKAEDIEGAKDIYVFITRPLPFSKQIEISVSVSGTRKDVRLEADAKGKIKTLEVK